MSLLRKPPSLNPSGGRVRDPDGESESMVQVTITRFTGAGMPVVVVGPVQIEPQSEPKPTLRLIRGGAS